MKIIPHAQPRVLIVDAETYVWDVVRLALQDRYRVTAVATRGAAISRLKNDPPCVILIDLILSEASGLPLVIHCLNRRVPMVVTTSEPKLARHLKQLGFPIVCKPYLMRELRECIDRAVTNADANLMRHHLAVERIRTNPRDRDALQGFYGKLRTKMFVALKSARVSS